MKKFLFSALLLILLPWTAVAAEPAFEYGQRPATGVFDPERRLSPELARELGEELSKVRHRDLADVLVVVLPSTGEVPPEHLAQRFSDAWGKGPLHAVVLDAANRNDGPWILFGGDAVVSDRNETIPQMVREILRRARQEPDWDSSLRAAAFEVSDLLRYLLGKIQMQGEAYRNERLRRELEQEHERHRRRMLLYGGGVALVTLCGIITLVVMGLMRRRALLFPPILWTRRFGAPHAGGNDAVLDLSHRRSPPVP